MSISSRFSTPYRSFRICGETADPSHKNAISPLAGAIHDFVREWRTDTPVANRTHSVCRHHRLSSNHDYIGYMWEAPVARFRPHIQLSLASHGLQTSAGTERPRSLAKASTAECVDIMLGRPKQHVRLYVASPNQPRARICIASFSSDPSEPCILSCRA